jgi:hypothetical protein
VRNNKPGGFYENRTRRAIPSLGETQRVRFQGDVLTEFEDYRLVSYISFPGTGLFDEEDSTLLYHRSEESLRISPSETEAYT